ncbi:hypothetical protein [Streptomyces albus]|uniref:hypothetical protein n=1 Tax=Streptomyces albus TaxID=1888 RepID=UPI0033CEA02D
MSGSGASGRRAAARSARDHALAVLRVRSTALALALLPSAAAVILWAGRATGQLGMGPGPGGDTARWVLTGLAVLTLACALVAGAVIARGRPAVSPTVPLDERAAPGLHALVRDLAERLEVPAPSAIALTPDCDSWLEDRAHRAVRDGERDGDAPGGPDTGHRPGRGEDGGAPARGRAAGGAGADGGARRGTAPVLVIGSPFLWWMRVAELRALLAPVVAGTGPSAHPDIAAARRFVRGLDAAVACAEHRADRAVGPGPPGGGATAVPRRLVHRMVGPLARWMLRAAGPHAAEMERGVAAAAAERAQAVDHGLRAAAQEQVGLAYAGWDRLLTRVALPAWRLGLWPTRLDAGVVSALTELSRRDRLAESFTSRLGERPACDLLAEPGRVDGAVSLLAARLFLGPRPPLSYAAGTGAEAEWTPVEWSAYPEEVVDRVWRTEAARLFAALDDTGSRARSQETRRAPASGPAAGGSGPAEDDEAWLAAGEADAPRPDRAPVPDAPAGAPASGRRAACRAASGGRASAARSSHAPRASRTLAPGSDTGPVSGDAPAPAPPGGGPKVAGPTLARVLERFAVPGGGEALAARISAQVARAEATGAPGVTGAGPGAGPWPGAGDTHPAPPAPMGLPLRPPRTGKELLADHVTAAVCCAAVDTAGAVPGLDWLDGPALFVDGERAGELPGLVLSLVEDGDTQGLREWLVRVGVRPEKPVRLV